MPISAEEHELLDFFGVEPVREDPNEPWPYTDFLYEIARDDESLSCAVAPGYKDIRLTLRRGDRRVYELNAVGVVDIRCQHDGDGAMLEILLSEVETIRLRLAPGIEIRQDFTGEA